jgi:hypothetical protein
MTKKMAGSSQTARQCQKQLIITEINHVARIGDMRKAYTISVGKPEGKRSLGRCGCRWEDNIMK